MQLLRLFLGLGVATLAHFFGLQMLPELGRGLDLFVVVIVLAAVDGDSLRGLLVGTTAGFVADALAGGPPGLHAFAGSVVGFATAKVGQRLILDRASAVLAAAALATLAHQTILFGLTQLVLPDRGRFEPLWWLIQALLGGLVAFTFVVTRDAALGARARARRERVERLRITR